MKILIVDDERAIIEPIAILLKNDGFTVLEAYDGDEALAVYEEHPDIDLILLDQMMPTINGAEVLRTIRESGSDVPIIIVSAKTSTDDRILGLVSGADDYINKPFSPMEVVVRVKTLLRRHQRATSPQPTQQHGIIEVGPLTIDRNERTVTTIEDEHVQLTGLEFDILYLLASNQGTVFSADEILKKVWGENSEVSPKNVMVHVSHLRDKIGEKNNGDQIVQTVWGVGYKIELSS